MSTWRSDVNRLMGWLDWNVWVKCKPACGPEEMCYLPTWPIGFPWPDWRRRGLRPGSAESSSGTLTGAHENSRTLAMKSAAATPEGGWSDMEPGPDDWIRPQPRCIRRVEPYDF
ncbi:hypothetical protein BDN67DRAFT_983357 [Paxillus ammoniavirescens]|nr:hypothetical protein BDN67DRAFT_983357 [Paxillus ammoniavirescens]